jgi:hypothetical protein
MRQYLKSEAQPVLPFSHLATLAAGDLLVILSFVWIGRSSHHFPLDDIGASLFTALPFVVGWFLITPWFGLYSGDVSQNWRKLVPRLLIGWAIGGGLALVLRALLLERSIVGGIIPTFAVISLGYIGLLALLWRLGYCWWVQRNAQDMGEARS